MTTEIDGYAFASFTGVDINASTKTLDFTSAGSVPREEVTIVCSPTTDASVEVKFYDDASKSNLIGTVTSTENSNLLTTGGGTIHATVEAASPFMEVDFTDDAGVANSTDGCAYIR